MNELHYQSLGQGLPVILLHGLFGMSDNLQTLARELADQYRVIVPDAINHGLSPHQSAVDYDSMALDLLRLMDRLQLDRAAVLGHSMGGKTAMQLAHNQPQRVACLLVADIAPVDYPPRHQAVFAAMLALREQAVSITRRSDADKLMAKIVDEPRVRQFLLKNLQHDSRLGWHWRCGLDEIIASYPAICAAPRLIQPCQLATLFIKGGESDYIDASAQPVIKQFFPQSGLKIIAGTGHWLHAEKPQIFSRLVRRFLQSHYLQD